MLGTLWLFSTLEAFWTGRSSLRGASSLVNLLSISSTLIRAALKTENPDSQLWPVCAGTSLTHTALIRCLWLHSLAHFLVSFFGSIIELLCLISLAVPFPCKMINSYTLCITQPILWWAAYPDLSHKAHHAMSSLKIANLSYLFLELFVFFSELLILWVLQRSTCYSLYFVFERCPLANCTVHLIPGYQANAACLAFSSPSWDSHPHSPTNLIMAFRCRESARFLLRGRQDLFCYFSLYTRCNKFASSLRGLSVMSGKQGEPLEITSNQKNRLPTCKKF